MKKITILAFLILCSKISIAQTVPFETLEAFSKEMSKQQYEVNGKTYNDGETAYEISFPEANFTVAFNSQLATNSVYKKSNGVELLYLTENFSMSRLSGFTTELIDNNVVLYKLDFGKFTVMTKIFEEGKLINTTYNNNLMVYAKYNKNRTGLNSDVFKLFFELSTRYQIEMGLIKIEKLDIENKDWLNLEKEDFVIKHPNSIRTKQLRIDIAKQKEQTITFMDSISNTFKIKIGMSEGEFKERNPEIAEELFKKKNTFIYGENWKSYSSIKKFPQIQSLVFKNEKLSTYSSYVQLYSMSDREAAFNKYKNFINANLSPKYFNINESQRSIIITHPTDNWTLNIFYRTDFDTYSNGFHLEFNFNL